MRRSAFTTAAALIAISMLGACGERSSNGADSQERAARPSDSAPGEEAPSTVATTSMPTLDVTVRSTSGAPLRGARVRLFPAKDESFSFYFGPPSTSGAAETRTATTDDRGVASLALAQGRRARLAIDAPGHVARVVDVPGDAARAIDVDLEPGHVLEGTVTDQVGAPLAGARVRFGSDFDRFTGLEPEVFTDDEGRYRFDGAPSNVVQVNVSPPGVTSSLVRAVVAPSVRRFDVEVALYGPITGIVHDAGTGRPLEGATVIAELGGWHSESVTASAETDADGRYVIPVWPKDGVGRIRPDRDGWYWKAAPDGSDSTGLPFPPDGPLEVDLWMSRGARLTGTVTGPDGPVEGVTVRVCKQRHRSSWSAETGTDGTYEIEGLARGDYVVLHAHGEYVGEWLMDPHGLVREGAELPPNGLRVAGREHLTHDIALDRGIVVSGRVVGPDGRGRPDVVVFGTGGKRDVTDSDGRFDLSGLRRDEALTVSIRGVDRDEGDGSAVTLGPEQTSAGRAEVELRWHPPENADDREVELRVSVVDENGDAVEGAEVAASAYGSSDALLLVTSRHDWVERSEDGEPALRVRRVGDSIGVHARAPGFAPGGVEISASAPDDVLEVRIELRPECVLSGTVVADHDEQPVEGVRVTLERPSTFDGILCRPGQDIEPTVVATSDADGAFEVRGLPSGKVKVAFEAPGFVSDKTTEVLTHGETTTVEPELARPRQISGTVALADGSPLVGARVGAARTWRSTRRRGTDGGRHAHTMTDERGEFVLRGLGSGRFDVTVTPPGGGAEFVVVERENVDPRDGPIELELPPHRALAGVVRDEEGAPVGDAKVTYALVDDERSYDRELTADSWGRYRLLVPEGQAMRIQASAPGLSPASVTIESGDAARDIVLTRGLTISGTLRDEGGKPLVATAIRARRVDGTTPWDAVPEAVTDGDGRFEFTGLTPGEYAVQGKYATGTASLLEPRVVSAGTENAVLVKLEPAELVVQFVDDRGDPVPGLELRFCRKNHAFVTSTDSDGRSTHNGLRPGSEWTVAFEDLGRPARPSRVMVAGTDEAPVVVLDLRRLSGRVVDGEGQPVAGARLGLRAVEDEDDRDHRLRTDQDGAFRLYGMTAERYAVVLYDASGQVSQRLGEVEVEDDLVLTRE